MTEKGVTSGDGERPHGEDGDFIKSSIKEYTLGQFSRRTHATNEQQATNDASDNPVTTLKKLKDMLDLGLIDQSEFNIKKQKSSVGCDTT